MPLKPMLYSKMGFAEVGTFGRSVYFIVKKHDFSDEPNLLFLNDKLNNDCTALEIRSGAITRDATMDKEVAAADQKRDITYKKILQHIRGCRKNLLPAISNAAEQLLNVFESHNIKLTSLSYESESHYLTALLSDLAEEENVAAISALNLTEHVMQLTEEHKAFEVAYNKRNSVNSTAVSDIQFSTLQSAVRKSLSYVINYIAILEVINPEKMKPVIDEINAAFSELAPKIQARITRAEKVDEKDDRLENASVS